MAILLKKYFALTKGIVFSKESLFGKGRQLLQLNNAAIQFAWDSLKFAIAKIQATILKFGIRPTGKFVRDELANSLRQIDFKKQQNLQLTIILPIYGQLGFVSKLASTLKKDVHLGVNLIVVDDAKDDYSSEWISKFFSTWDNTRVIRNRENLGYLKSVNLGYKEVNTRFVLLLNSDTQLPEGWLERSFAALESTGACLATPLATNSGGNLTLNIPDSMSWRAADRVIAKIAPNYPNAATAIGYCLFIDRDQLDQGPLLSSDYTDGYGEDSDLHYRVVTNGLRSIVIDNLLVLHESGASYEHKKNIDLIRVQNRTTFLSKWEREYQAELKNWNRLRPIKRLQDYINRASKAFDQEFDIVFVAPTIELKAGGISIIRQLAEHIDSLGFKVAIVSMTKTRGEFPLPVFHKNEFWRISKVSRVIATGIGTFELSEALVERYGATQVLLLQGPELFFDNGIHLDKFSRFIKNSELILCVSNYLGSLARQFSEKNVFVAPFGPDTESYYTTDSPREKLAVISSRLNVEKGTVYSVPLVDYLIRSGWRVASIGPTHPSFQKLAGIQNLGNLSAEQIRELLNKASIFIDTSVFEGMGLLPLEAIACGCVPIINTKGGTESILNDSKRVEWLHGPVLTQEAFARHVENALSKLVQNNQSRENIFVKHNLKAGLALSAREIVRHL